MSEKKYIDQRTKMQREFDNENAIKTMQHLVDDHTDLNLDDIVFCEVVLSVDKPIVSYYLELHSRDKICRVEISANKKAKFCGLCNTINNIISGVEV